jgi:N-hydroxyarylamine O-acetyltransferase
MANHFTSTYPGSPFVLNLTAQRARAERRVALRNRELVVRERGLATVTTLRDAAHRSEVLEAEFGLVFPAGTPFRAPAF